MAPANLEELSRLGFDAVRRIDNHDDTVGCDQRAVGVFTEILVTWSIEQRHTSSLQLELQRRRRNGNAALLLELHPVRGGGLPIFPAAHGASQLDGARIQQQLLRERGLAGVRVRDDCKGPPPRDLALELTVD